MNLKKIITFFIGLVAVISTLHFLISLDEYINVGILKNVDGYIFGNSGPTAGTKYYENAASYSNAMLHFSLTGLLSTALLWLGVFKQKMLFIYIGISVIILDIIISNIIY